MRGGGTDTYGRQEFAAELDQARANPSVGTSLWFENEHVRVWEVRLEPGQRAPFHSHGQTYFWTCIDPGKGYQRFPDGTAEAFDFTLGETVFHQISADDPMIHDLENTDDHLLRFVAIELKDL
jgi:beta-alanine degradation protein BauB